MKNHYTQQELLHKAAAYCSSSEHCSCEVEDKLAQWGASTNEIETIINKLQKEGFINQDRYARFFVKDKYRFNKWGKVKISFALQQKKIDENLISQALNEIDEQEYKIILSELLKSKIKTIKSDNDYEKKGKLVRFAQSRGFEYSDINKILKSLI